MRLLICLTSILMSVRLFSFQNLSSTTEKMPYKFALEPTLPEFVVFNVDELIWPFQVDTVMTPPLKATSVKYQIRDRMGKLYDLFPEAGPVLEELFSHWYKVGGLVQSTDPEKIENLMQLYDIERFFKIFEVFPKLTGSKIKHMKRLSDRMKIPTEDILYFDTNEEELEEVKNELNVVAVHVPASEGLTYKHIRRGFQMYYDAKNYTLEYHYNYITTDMVTIVHEDR